MPQNRPACILYYRTHNNICVYRDIKAAIIVLGTYGVPILYLYIIFNNII